MLDLTPCVVNLGVVRSRCRREGSRLTQANKASVTDPSWRYCWRFSLRDRRYVGGRERSLAAARSPTPAGEAGGLNQLVKELNQLVKELNQLVKELNQLVKEFLTRLVEGETNQGRLLLSKLAVGILKGVCRGPSSS